MVPKCQIVSNLEGSSPKHTDLEKCLLWGVSRLVAVWVGISLTICKDAYVHDPVVSMGSHTIQSILFKIVPWLTNLDLACYWVSYGMATEGSWAFQTTSGFHLMKRPEAALLAIQPVLSMPGWLRQFCEPSADQHSRQFGASWLPKSQKAFWKGVAKSEGINQANESPEREPQERRLFQLVISWRIWKEIRQESL